MKSLTRCLSPARLGDLNLRNRLLKAATFEGRTPGGQPTDALVDVHVRLGEGGIGMTTIAGCASEPDGRMHQNQMFMGEHVREPLCALIAQVHATGARVSGQLVHCGTFTKNREFRGSRPRGPSSGFNAFGLGHGLLLTTSASVDDIRQRVRSFADAARFMKSVGFDAIELHYGHGYGICQFLSPRTNRRTDAYGGSFEHRMRFGLEVLAAVREAVGDGFPILAKISMEEGIRGGIALTESLELARTLDKGGVDAIICSAGSSVGNPMLIFHGDSLAPGLIQHEKTWWMKALLAASAPFMFRAYPFRPNYLLDSARAVREAVQCSVCYIGGCTSAQDVDTIMAAGFDLIALGRAILFDPDMPHHLQTQSGYQNGCSHCNRCATMIEAPGGIDCVERPGQFARRLPRALER